MITPQGQFEVEQKFRVDDHAAVEAHLRALGATASAAVEQVDRYYRHPVRDFASTDEALRVRVVAGERAWITYKGPKLDATTKTRREIEFPIDIASADSAHELLVSLGFVPLDAIRKLRREARLTWEDQPVVVALDVVDGVGTFVEVELPATDGTLDLACACLASLSARLGLTDSERRSYLELFLAGEGAA